MHYANAALNADLPIGTGAGKLRALAVLPAILTRTGPSAAIMSGCDPRTIIDPIGNMLKECVHIFTTGTFFQHVTNWRTTDTIGAGARATAGRFDR